MRLLAAAVLGLATLVISALVLSDYPMSGNVPWVAAILIPFLIGAIMVIVSDGYETSLWVMTGPMAAVSIAWGARISTHWGLEPLPRSVWVAVAIAFLWPPAWGGIEYYRSMTAAAARRRARAEALAQSAAVERADAALDPPPSPSEGPVQRKPPRPQWRIRERPTAPSDSETT